ncbi:MAG: hypothetical protein LQ343_006836 [Gyalolechia ehrenbergii]|nr:MAG: hypothetical protein LQ343_006836 [Gyalolechia ehrenbergii]
MSLSSAQNDKMEDGNHCAFPNDNPKPVVRACDSCRLRKARCLPLGPSTCQRCAKTGRECVSTLPEKRQKRKRTDTRLAELEHTVQVLATKLEHEQRARLEQSHRLRGYSDNKRATVLGSTISRASDLLDPSLSGQESLRQYLAQHANYTTSLKTGEVSLAGPMGTYTSSSPSDFSTSERYKALSRLDAAPSPSSILASIDTMSPTFISYQSPSIRNQQAAYWPTSNPFYGLPPQQTGRNNHFYSSGYSYPQEPSLASALRLQIQSFAISGVPSSNPAFGNTFAFASTRAYSSNTLDNTSVPLQMQGTWGLEPSNDH